MEYEMSTHAIFLITSAIFAVLGIVSIALTVYFRQPNISVLQVLIETKAFFNSENFLPIGKRTRWLVLVFLMIALVFGLLAIVEASKTIEVL